MVNSITNQLLYSMNQSDQSDEIGTEIKKDVIGTGAQALSAIGTILDVGAKVAHTVQETIDAFNAGGTSGLDINKFQLVPTAIENLFGNHYVDTVCPESERDTESEMERIAQEVGAEIIAQSERDDLDYEIRVKKDDEINSHILPGGKIIITTGLLKELHDTSLDDEDFRLLLSGLMGYLVATAAESQPVKKAQIGGLFGLVKKIVSFVTSWFTPEKTSIRLTPEEKKKKTAMKIVNNSLDLGEKVTTHYQSQAADQKAREMAVEYCNGAGYPIEREELDDVLNTIAFTEDPDEKREEIIDQMFRTIRPLAAKLVI